MPGLSGRYGAQGEKGIHGEILGASPGPTGDPGLAGLRGNKGQAGDEGPSGSPGQLFLHPVTYLFSD